MKFQDFIYYRTKYFIYKKKWDFFPASEKLFTIYIFAYNFIRLSLPGLNIVI